MEDTLQTWGRPQSSSSRSGDMSGLLFVGGLPLHACDQNLTRYFRRFGPLDSAEVQRRSSGRSKGYAFIQFVRPADAQKALAEGHTILGQQVSLRPVERPMEEVVSTEWNPRSTRRVYVTGIPKYLDQAGLLRVLSRKFRIEKVSEFRHSNDPNFRCCYIVLQRLADAEILLQQKAVTTEKGDILQICRQLTNRQPFLSNREGNAHFSDVANIWPNLQNKFSRSHIKNFEPASNTPVDGHSQPIGWLKGKDPEATNGYSSIRIRKGLEIQSTPTQEYLQNPQESNYRFQMTKANIAPALRSYIKSIADEKELPTGTKLEKQSVFRLGLN